MNLGDLIEELRENILHDRSDRVEGSEDDQLWSDKTLVRYINEAQTRFAKKTTCLRSKITVRLIAGTIRGDLLLTLHQPNESPLERAVFRRVVEADGTIVLDGEAVS